MPLVEGRVLRMRQRAPLLNALPVRDLMRSDKHGIDGDGLFATGAAAAANMPQPNLIALPADIIKRLDSYDLAAPVSLQQTVLRGAAAVRCLRYSAAVASQLMQQSDLTLEIDTG